MIIIDDDTVRARAKNARTVAVVGISENTDRPSYQISQKIKNRYKLYFVNPKYAGRTILEEPVYERLAQIPKAVDIVNVFRNPRHAESVISESIEANARAIWFQPGSENIELIRRYKDSIDIIYNSCLGVVSSMV
jgi:hypothetical protein